MRCGHRYTQWKPLHDCSSTFSHNILYHIWHAHIRHSLISRFWKHATPSILTISMQSKVHTNPWRTPHWVLLNYIQRSSCDNWNQPKLQAIAQSIWLHIGKILVKIQTMSWQLPPGSHQGRPVHLHPWYQISMIIRSSQSLQQHLN